MTVAQQGGSLIPQQQRRIIVVVDVHIPQQLDGTAVTDSAERFRQGSVDPAAFLNLVSSFCIPGRGNNIVRHHCRRRRCGSFRIPRTARRRGFRRFFRRISSSGKGDGDIFHGFLRHFHMQITGRRGRFLFRPRRQRQPEHTQQNRCNKQGSLFPFLFGQKHHTNLINAPFQYTPQRLLFWGRGLSPSVRRNAASDAAARQ